jgi:hypothetical protein
VSTAVAVAILKMLFRFMDDPFQGWIEVLFRMDYFSGRRTPGRAR